MSASVASLGFNEATLSGSAVHVNAIHIATPDNILSADIAEVPRARAEDYYKHITSVLDQIVRVYHALYTEQDIDAVRNATI